MSKVNDAIKSATDRGYCINDNGDIFYNGKIRKLDYDKWGYARFGIKNNGKNINIPVHKFQAYKKYGDIIFMDGMTVRHLNGNSRDNTTTNIDYGTLSVNIMDMPKEKRICRGKHASSFMTKHDPSKIKNDHINGLSYSILMKKYNISSKGTLSYIINYR